MNGYFDRINLALEISAKAHKRQKRKGTNIPYIIHPFGVALILTQEGYDEDLVIAGILHDVVEDTMITIKTIEEKFGKRVAEIVAGCTEPEKYFSWKKRKIHTLEILQIASTDIRIVSCADKLHNIRTMINAYEKIGEKVWKRFKAGREDYKWYFTGLVSAFLNGKDDSILYHRLEKEVKYFFNV